MTWQRLVNWIRRVFRIYEKEIKTFVDDMLELAFLNIDTVKSEKITPAIKEKVRNKVLADILIMGIDIGTTKGKSEIGKLIIDSIDWFIKEGE